jgi:rhodanese-related sulfurtransferase
MRKLILIAFLATVAALAQQGTNQNASPSKAKKLTRVEFENLLSHPDQILLLDVRRPDEIASNGGFPVYLSIQAGDLQKHLSEIPKDRMIITVSNHAGRASLAADLLVSKGFNVAGAIGAQTYEAEGGKLVKIEPPKPSNQK